MNLYLHRIICICTLLLAPTATYAVEIVVQALSENKVLVTINGQNHLLHVGDISPEGVKLMSADSKEAVFIFENQIIHRTLHDRTKILQSDAQGNTITIVKNYQGQYQTDGKINDYHFSFSLRPDIMFVLLSKKHAEDLTLDYKQEKNVIFATTPDGVKKTYRVTLNNVSIGNISLNRVHAIVQEDLTSPEVLIGRAFLRHLTVIENEGQLILKRE